MSRKILVVDDDTSQLALYRLVLKKAGYDVVSAEDGVSAMTRYREFKPDLVILDFAMPAGTGLEVLRRLREVMLEFVPVLFITGTSVVLPQNLAQYGNVSFLLKPVNLPKLVLRVHQILGDWTGNIEDPGETRK